jgi:hypothetical protein
MGLTSPTTTSMVRPVSPAACTCVVLLLLLLLLLYGTVVTAGPGVHAGAQVGSFNKIPLTIVGSIIFKTPFTAIGRGTRFLSRLCVSVCGPLTVRGGGDVCR